MLPVETNSETSTPEAAAKPSLADLLNDPEPETGSHEGAAGESPSKAEPPKAPQGAPKDFKALAERLGIESRDLYAVEVPMSDGQGVSLGKLKDAWAEREEFTRRELEFAETKAKQEADWTRSQQELREILSALPKNAITPQVLELVRNKVAAEQQIERGATLRAIPEWADEGRRDADIKGMVEMLEGYGFSPQFLQTVQSHKMLKFIRDAWQRKERVERALAQVQPVKRPGTEKSKPNGTAKKPSSAQPVAGKGPEARLMALLND